MRKTQKTDQKFDPLAYQHFSTLDVTRYDFPSWQKSQHGTKEEWDIVVQPDQPIDRAFETFTGIEERHSEADVIRLCVIDEEYYAWLGSRTDTEQERLSYMQSLTDEDAKRLFRKHPELSTQYSVMFLPITISFRYPQIYGETSYRLNDVCTKLFRRYLERVFRKESAYVPGCLIDMVDVDDPETEDRLINMAKAYFKDGVSVKYGKWDVQEDRRDYFDIDEENLFSESVRLYIPYIIRAEVTDPCIPDNVEITPENAAQYAQLIDLTPASYEEIGLTGIPDLVNTRLYEVMNSGVLAENETAIAMPEIYSIMAGEGVDDWMAFTKIAIGLDDEDEEDLEEA